MSQNGTANGNVKHNLQRVNGTISQLSTEDSLELHFDDHRFLTELLGQHDGHLRTIEGALGVRIGVNGSALKISGGHIEQALAGKLLSEFATLARRDAEDEPAKHAPAPKLTDREMEVLRLVARGMNNRDIAKELFISENTVKNHVRNILEKLQIHSRMEAVMIAVREKLIEIS